VTKPVGRARRVPFGPFGDWLPSRFTGTIWDYAERPLRVTISASFDGTGRVKVDSVAVERTDGESVTPEDMARLQLAAVVSSIVWDATVHGPGVIAGWGRDPARAGMPPSDDELRRLARMYWQEYVSWGNPRRQVMSWFDVPRSTANRWIRKARDLYGLPGPHADEEA